MGFLLIAVSAFAILFAWYSQKVNLLRKERELYETLVNKGLYVEILERDQYMIESFFGQHLYPCHYSISCNQENICHLQQAKALTHVQELSISECHVPVPSLSEFSNLKSLTVRDTKLESLDVIKNCKNLRSLDLLYCYELNDIDELSNLQSLEALRVHGPVFVKYCDRVKIPNRLTHLTIWGWHHGSLEKIMVRPSRSMVFFQCHFRSLEGIREFNKCKTINFFGSLIDDISALKQLEGSSVQKVLLPEKGVSHEEAKEIDKLMPNIKVELYDE